MVRQTSLMLLLLISVLVVNACAPAVAPMPDAQENITRADLSGIKIYLLGKTSELKAGSADLVNASGSYYELAKAANFDYVALWAEHPAEAKQALLDAKAAWMKTSPLYEQIEGIVAGVPSLSTYDVILDAGASGADNPENAVPFDLNLPDGRVLPKPGNLFGVLETTLWGTHPDYVIAGVEADLNANGTLDFGEVLPDANVLKAAADLFDQYVAELNTSAQAWTPSETDAFTALVVMVPTMSEYFESWKNSRFVAGAASAQSDFVVISRLSDILDILSSLEVIYAGVKPMVMAVNPNQAAQIENDLASLKQYVADVYSQEQGGKKFSAEDAELLGAEAQNRATAIAGQIAQAAAALNVKIEE